jgi:hypothetical protein
MTTLPAVLRALAERVEAGRLRGADAERLGAAVAGASACIERDSALRRAAELIDPAGELAVHTRARRLGDELRRFEATAWPRIARGARAPRSPLEAALAAALACPLPAPSSTRHLYRILTR